MIRIRKSIATSKILVNLLNCFFDPPSFFSVFFVL